MSIMRMLRNWSVLKLRTEAMSDIRVSFGVEGIPFVIPRQPVSCSDSASIKRNDIALVFFKRMLSVSLMHV